MRRLLVLLLGLALLATGGLGGAAMFGYGPLAPLFGTEKKKAAPAPPAEPKQRTVAMGSFIIPVIQNHAIGRQIGMDIEIKVWPKHNEDVARLMPRLKHAYLLRLYDLVPRHSDPHSAADQELIHDELAKINAAICGPEAIDDVVIKSMYQR